VAKSKADWEAIEREYRAGILSVREIARRHGITEGPIRRKAKEKGWERDLTQKVKTRAQEKLSRSGEDAQDATGDATATRVDEARAVEENADRVVGVVTLHRRDIRTGRETVEMMLDELRAECKMPGLSEMAEQHIEESSASQREAQAIRKAVSLPGRAGVMRDLSQSMQRLINLERQAYSIDEDSGDEAGGLAEALSKARRRARQIEQDDDS